MKCKLKRIQIQILCIQSVQHGDEKCGFSFQNAYKSIHTHMHTCTHTQKAPLAHCCCWFFVDVAFFALSLGRDHFVYVHVCVFNVCICKRKCKFYADELLLSILSLSPCFFGHFGRSNFYALAFLLLTVI